MLSTAGGHCVAQHPPRQGSDPVGRFMPAARLDASQGRKQLLCCDRRDRPAAKVRVKSALQPRAQNGYGLRGERLALQLEPFLRHALEGLEKRRALLETFEGVAKEWLELQSKSLAPETISILGTRLKSALYPYLGSRPVAAITAQELLAALRRIEARGRHETAHRVRALAGRVLRYAVATGRAQHDVAADLRDALAPVKSRNVASVTDPVRVGELLRAIDGYYGNPVTMLALKLAPLVFVRPGELRAAE